MSSPSTPASTPGSDPSPEQPPSTDPAAPTKQRRKRSWRRILLIGLTSVIALALIGRIIIAVAFPHVLKKVAATYDLEATYARMEFYALGGDVGLWDLTIRPKGGGKPLMTTEYARGDVSALNLLRGKLVVHRAELDGMMLDIERDASGRIAALEQLLAGGSESQTREEQLEVSLDPPLRVDAVRVNRFRAHWVDRSVTPVVDTELEMTLRLSDFGAPGRPTRLLIEGTSPPLLDTVRIEGTAETQANRLDAKVNLLVRGLHPKPAAGYFAPLGIRPIADGITLTGAAEVALQTSAAPAANAPPATRPAHISGSVILTKMSATADGQEAGGIDRIELAADALSGSALRLSKVTIDGARGAASRTAEGNIRVAGLELSAPAPSPTPSTQPSSPPVSTATTPTATQPAAIPLAVAMGELEVRNARMQFHDAAVAPVAELAFLVDKLAVTGIDSAAPNAPAKIAGVFSAPGVAKSVHLAGTMRPFAATRTIDAKLTAKGIRPDAIRQYLDGLGIESTLTDATATGVLHAAISTPANGTMRADARLTDITLTDAAAGEVAAFQSAHVSGLSIDPAGTRVRVEAMAFIGPRFAAQRKADGTLSAFGFQTRALAPKPVTPMSTAPTLVAPTPAKAEASPASGPSAPPLALPRFELGRLSWKGVDVRLVDQAIAPPTNLHINDAGVELSDIVVDLRAGSDVAAPGKACAWLAAPGLADSLKIEGTVTPAAGSINAQLSVTGTGLRGDLLAPYLKSAGIEPVLRDGSLQMQTAVSLARKDGGETAASFEVKSLRYADGEQELAGLDRLAVADAAMTPQGIAVASVEIDKPRAWAQRNEDGSFLLAGLRVNVPSTQPATAEERGSSVAPRPASAASPATAPAVPFVATLGRLRINDGSLGWIDRAVTPQVETAGHASVELDRFVFGRDAEPATLKILASLDSVLEQFSATGEISPSMTSPKVKLDLSGSGVREGALAAYLPAGTNIALKDGRFRATLAADAAAHPEGGQTANLVVSNVDYRDGETKDPLLAFDSAKVLVSRVDVPGKIVAINELSLDGFQAAGRKSADGAIHALGLKLTTPPPTPGQDSGALKGSVPSTAPSTVPTSALAIPPSTQPDGSGDFQAMVAAGREKLPLISLAKLAVNLKRVSFKDESQPQSSPITLADVLLTNKAPIELLGSDPQSRPPVDLELVGKIDPIVGRFNIATQVTPFASQPTLQISVDASGIKGAGVTAVMPALREQIDGAGLTDGRFTASLEATAKVARSGPARLDFSRPMEIAAVVRDVGFRGDGKKDSPVLAGVQEVRADAVRFDPASGSVVARTLEISRPTARAWRDARGVHALGFVINMPTTQPATDAATPPAKSPGPKVARAATSASKPSPAAIAAAKPAAEMTIGKVIVSGIDVNIEDRSVDPPLIVPLNSLEAEVRGLSNLVTYERRPIRFNVTAGAGKVPLGGDNPAREMFSEIAASGNLTLFPSPSGWARSSVSGLEMLSLRGPAAASKVNIQGGVFDSRVDVRLQPDSSMNVRSRFAFTDLRMSEPRDGLIRRVLKLPGPLDAMIVVLQDASGAITIPLNVTVEESNVSAGQIAGAGVTALGSVFATAMASAPLKFTGGVTQLTGLDQILLFGGKKAPTGPQSAGEIRYYAGTTDASSTAATVSLRQLIERMRRDPKLEVTLRHELGGGDIARASQRANPSAEAASAVGASLRTRKAELLRQREQLAPAVRAMIVAGSTADAARLTGELRQTERQIAATEDALDRAYELTRPGADRQADRRTRTASLAIAKARLDAMKQMIIAARIPDAEKRVRVINPKFTPAEGDAGGQVVMSVTLKKLK